MADLGPVGWPPEPIHTDRLVLRRAEGRDRAGFIDLHTSPEVGRYVGGARVRAELEEVVPEVPGDRPGVFVVERDGAFIGTVSFVRRDRELPGHVRPEGGEIDVGYLFLPAAWGFGYASEAIRAALEWVAGVLPGEPVVLCTQSAMRRRSGSRGGWVSSRWSGSSSTAPSSGSVRGADPWAFSALSRSRGAG